MVKPISRTLFDLLAIGTRPAATRMFTTELSWWSDLDGDILGTVVLHHEDQDYGWALLARNRVGRFRFAVGDVSLRWRDSFRSRAVGFGRASTAR